MQIEVDLEILQKAIIFTQDELEALQDGLSQLILDGFADDPDDPIVTALDKVSSTLEDMEEQSED